MQVPRWLEDDRENGQRIEQLLVQAIPEAPEAFALQLLPMELLAYVWIEVVLIGEWVTTVVAPIRAPLAHRDLLVAVLEGV